MDSTAIAQPERLPRLIEQAAAALAKATTAAEVLEARDAAALAYNAAKAAARFAKAKQAHDEIIAACRKAQADALRIEARAQCRLADEYDAAQARGEVAKHSSGNPQIVPKRNDLPLTTADLGLDRKDLMTARRIRDAEKARPGIVEKTLAATGAEPTRARLMRAVEETLTPPKPPPVREERAATEPAAASVAEPQATRDIYECVNYCSFCGQEFEIEKVLSKDREAPLCIYANDDLTAGICLDCVEDASLAFWRDKQLRAGQRRKAKRAAEKAAAQNPHKA